MQALRDKAAGGDAMAARAFLERTMGRARVEPIVLESIEFPELTDSKAVVEANSKLLSAVASGEVDVGTATQMSTLIENGRRSLELVEVERRLEELEEKLRGQARATL